MEILLIETNENTKELIQNRLKNEFAIEVTSLGEEGLELAKIYDYDLIIMGRMLADSDGFQVLKQMRAQKVRTPIMFLCGMNNADLKVRAFQSGADECMSIPFNLAEFVERVKLLVRHRHGHLGEQIHVGRLTIVPSCYRVLVDDKIIALTVKEYEILEFLCLNKNKNVTEDQILDHIYLHEVDRPYTRTVHVWISYIRKKLRSTLGNGFIKTTRGRGYMISDPD
jgi:two-component system cell cycle response regulator CtrA